MNGWIVACNTNATARVYAANSTRAWGIEMKLSLSTEEFQKYVVHQLNHFFPDNQLNGSEKLFTNAFLQALERTEYCFKHVALKAYHHNGVTRFSHCHADQYTMFLWFLSNSVWREFEDDALASKLFYFNKILNGVMCMYDAQMPDIFLILHGNGIVLGKAKYDNFLVCCQGCTVGAVHGVYPVFGRGVALAPYATVVGNSTLGDYVTIGTGASIRNRNIDSESVYYRDTDTGQAVIKRKERAACWAQSYFNVPIFPSEAQI